MTEPAGWIWHTDGSWSMSLEWTGISLDMFAILTGTPLVDLSIEFEPWLVRGDQ